MSIFQSPAQMPPPCPGLLRQFCSTAVCIFPSLPALPANKLISILFFYLALVSNRRGIFILLDISMEYRTSYYLSFTLCLVCWTSIASTHHLGLFLCDDPQSLTASGVHFLGDREHLPEERNPKWGPGSLWNNPRRHSKKWEMKRGGGRVKDAAYFSAQQLVGECRLSCIWGTQEDHS